MKVNELMIGDWVDFGYFMRQVIQPDYYQDVNGDCVLDGTQPIPLTAEILEKNGFVSKKGFMQKGNFGDGPLIIWHTEDNKILRHFTHELEISDLSSDKGYRIRFICNYVHDIQHALRLCGIEKEIVL